ncbi:hypothetical protein TruAng_006445 [Truncatella angustata]|nr:hypothetical protein TruAng_006445 [Truncatella angustata]
MAHYEVPTWSPQPTDAASSQQDISEQSFDHQHWHDQQVQHGRMAETSVEKSMGVETMAVNDQSVAAASPNPTKQVVHKKWWQLTKTAEEKLFNNLNDQFSGKRGWNGHFYYKPRKPDEEHQDHAALAELHYGGSLRKDEEGKFEYRNQFGQKSAKYSDVAVYLSPTNYVPKRLIVQATDYVLQHNLAVGDWRRRKMTGDVPIALRLAEWALDPVEKKGWWRRIDGTLRVLVICVPLQICLSLPLTNSWENEDTFDTYTDFPGYHWQWPKHAINPLDQKPLPNNTIIAPERLSSRRRLIRPRQLVVQQCDGSWQVEVSAPAGLQYVFISFADKAFSSESGRLLIQRMAACAALEAGCTAYWLDFLCRAEYAGDLLDSDVYRMCDVIRGSSRVVVMLPDAHIASKKNWGSRMWTLPEALLAPENRCYFSHPDGEGQMTHSMTLVEMTAEVWEDPVDSEEDGGPTRLLAEHYTNLLTLSRLELFSTALDALWRRAEVNYNFFTPNDVTYALMGLLHYRINRDDTDTEFQSIAQLSLGNDSDRIVERMVSLYPKPDVGISNPFRNLATKDLFKTHLWDIEPTCQVVGVAHENNTVLLDSCRAMHIRWKGFPRPVVARDMGFRRFLATVFVTASTWWLIQGIGLAIYYAPFYSSSRDDDIKLVIKWMVAGFVFVAIALSAFGPFSVRRLYGGQVLQSASNLVAFEGVMPIAKLERLIFGNDNSRLSYEASSTPFSEHFRHPSRRVGFEPNWIRNETPELTKPNLPKGHKLFTLVDTGELTVSIFSAERPPTVALLCGREGGMLRAVLCSWQFENDCLYKETVVRMPTNVWESATPKGWLKVCLGSLDQEREGERVERLKRERDANGAGK